ncbi:MAG: pantoate--beta-alanine ligase [Bacteroidales bacterium]|nr:pantoate--beta-alanine ligase [Bacteroidales bacterium]
MQVIEKISDIQAVLSGHWNNKTSIGFVPTMGALHNGHLSLIKNAGKENDLVVCSIFVNPVQFNNKEDFKSYPRDIQSDLNILEKVKCDIVFHPSAEEMYPGPVDGRFDFGDLDKVMEGAHRPGHFNGVAIVVSKLFDIVKPARAYFGLKDFQQLVIIYRLVKDHNIPVEIVPCTTVREEDGLAMSSRNKLLGKTERRHAVLLYKSLKMAKVQSGYLPVAQLKKMIEESFRHDKVMKLEYFEIVDMLTLKPIKLWSESKQVVACIAAYAGNIRLIDNLVIFS